MPEENVIKVGLPQLADPIQGLVQGAVNRILVEQKCVPIIFVPGIMGTRLKNAQGDKVWDPDAPVFMLRKYGLLWCGPSSKKQRLIGETHSSDTLAVYDDDEDHNREFFASDFPHAAEQGWGGVAWGSYGDVLTGLERRTWSLGVGLGYTLPVYAFGYNWTNSNEDSGRLLHARIEELKKKHSCEKVILVTHSMGGLVARAACALHGASSSVLGVVHGVQPVTGAPAAYWRMKAGFERNGSLMSSVTAWVLGTNGEEVSALLGNMPGGLQLLPSQDYQEGSGQRQWLQFVDRDEQSELHVQPALPQSDPYREIYEVDAKRHYWGLVYSDHLWPDRDDDSPISTSNLWELYKRTLEEAKQVHARMGLVPDYPAEVFYGDGREGTLTADRVVFLHTRTGVADRVADGMGMVARAGAAAAVSLPVGAAVLGAELFFRSDLWQLRGGFRAQGVRYPGSDNLYDVVLERPSGPGDGTVPTSSGSALKGVRRSQAYKKLEHEPAYTRKAAGHAEGPGMAGGGQPGPLGFTYESIERFCLEDAEAQVGHKLPGKG